MWSLQAGRGSAALAVVFGHAENGTTGFVEPVPAAVVSVTQFGNLGVDFFFTLSGFIIYYVNIGKTAERGWTRRYIESRFLRIFVPYLPLGVGIALLYTAFPALAGRDHEWGWISTITLLPSGSPPALSVAWTLQHELVFYLLGMVFFRLPNALWGGFAWAFVIIAALLWGERIGGLPTHSGADVLLHPVNLEFVCGMLACWAFVNRRFDAPALLWAAGAVSLAAFVLEGAHRSHSFLLGPLAACVILAATRAERGGKLAIAKWLILLGNASYAIYLLNNPIVSVATRLVGSHRLLRHWHIGLPAGVVAAVAVGIAYHLAFERPMLGRARKAIGKRRPLFREPQAGA